MRTKNSTVENICLIVFLVTVLLPVSSVAQDGVRPIGGQRWAVLVGIDDYEHLQSLTFAVNDTIWLCSALVEACQFPPENIFPLVTDWRHIKSMRSSEGPPLEEDFWRWFEHQKKKPTKDNLIERLKLLKNKVQPGDLVLFYFAGHGILLESEAHIAMVEAKTTDLRLRGPGCVRMDDLSAILHSLSARAVVVVFDACRQSLTRGVEAGAAGIPSNTLDDAFSRNIVIRPSARRQLDMAATLFSCKVGQASHEWPEKKHGFFSYYLTRALLGAAADEKGKVTLNSLEAYLSREVAAAVKSKLSREQVPWLAREGTNPGSLVLSWSGLLPPGSRIPSATTASDTDTKTVCVHSFSDITESNELRHLGLGLAEGIASRLANAPKIRVVERSQLRQIVQELKLQRPDLADQKSVAQLGNLLGADFSLVGSFEHGDILKVNARVVNNITSEVVCGVSKTSNDRNYLEEAIAYEVAKSLGSLLPEPISAMQTSVVGKSSESVQAAKTSVVKPLITDYEDEAIAFFDAKDYARAFRLYCRISDQDIDDVNTHRQIEKCARFGHLERQFLERYLALTEQYPNSAVIGNYLGNAYLMIDPKDRTGKAREYYEKALLLDPEFAAPFCNLGIIASRQGDIAKAESMFRRYLTACPYDATGWVNKGLLHLEKVEEDPNDTDEVVNAEKAFKEGIRLEPGLASAYKGSGRLYSLMGRKPEALASFQSSFVLDRNQPWVRQQIGLLEWELGGARSSATLNDGFETRIIHNRGIAELAKAVCAALTRNDPIQAQALAVELCKTLPGNGLAWRLLAKSYEEQGKVDHATQALDEANRLLR